LGETRHRLHFLYACSNKETPCSTTSIKERRSVNLYLLDIKKIVDSLAAIGAPSTDYLKITILSLPLLLLALTCITSKISKLFCLRKKNTSRNINSIIHLFFKQTSLQPLIFTTGTNIKDLSSEVVALSTATTELSSLMAHKLLEVVLGDHPTLHGQVIKIPALNAKYATRWVTLPQSVSISIITNLLHMFMLTHLHFHLLHRMKIHPPLCGILLLLMTLCGTPTMGPHTI